MRDKKAMSPWVHAWPVMAWAREGGEICAEGLKGLGMGFFNREGV